jgi:hypothetical protein
LTGSTAKISSCGLVRKRPRAGLDKLRKRYPEIRGKVVDFVQQSFSDGILYVGICLTDKTVFSFRYACNMFVVGAAYLDGKTGNFETIREFMKPIPTQGVNVYTFTPDIGRLARRLKSRLRDRLGSLGCYVLAVSVLLNFPQYPCSPGP